MAIRPLPLSAAITSALAFLFQLVAAAKYMGFFDVVSHGFTMLVPAALICIALFKDGRWMPAALASTMVGSGAIAARVFDYVTEVSSEADGYGLRVVILLLAVAAMVLAVIEAAQLGYLKLENHPVRKADGTVPVAASPALAQQAAHPAAQPTQGAPAAAGAFQPATTAPMQAAFQPGAAQQAAPAPAVTAAEQAAPAATAQEPAAAAMEAAGHVAEPAAQQAGGQETAAPAVQATPAAGWYADPANAAQLRYWDGAAWTNQTQPRA